MKLAFRIDDITQQMDWDSFLKFKELMDRYHIKPLLGIVPKCEDENLNIMDCPFDYWDYLRSLQDDGWYMAQHGYNHVYVTKNAGIFPVNNYSEFAGLSFDEQLRKIQLGREILREQEIHTSTFMAPAHSFDELTIEALKMVGFHYITDGCQKNVYQRQGMIYIPIALNFRRMGRYVNHNQVTTIVVHTNHMSDELFCRYEKICEKYQSVLADYEELYDEPVGAYQRIETKKEFAILGCYSIVSSVYRIIKH